MTDLQRSLLRAAAQIRERLVTTGRRPAPACLPDYSWDKCAGLERLLNRAAARGWHVAADYVQRQLSYELQTLRRRLDELNGQFADRPTPFVASQREIYEDLLAIDAEFDGVELDLKQKQISVRTEQIELEGVYLGSFRIVLDWESIGSSSPYRVVATDPQEAATSSSTTHPHVNDDRLCEGEAQTPIRHALKQGRLFDFFTIVCQTLQTYNAASAYVRLCNWLGIECDDCGAMVNDDGRYTCEGCETNICGDCVACCDSCGNDLCSQCVSRCSHCEQQNCQTCLSTCDSCGADFCKECRKDDQCNECRLADDEQRREEERECVSSGPEILQAVSAEVHPHRLGQAAAPA